MKNYVNKLGDIWYHKKFDSFWDQPNRSEAHEFTQADVTSLIKGNVNLSVIALYALEDILDYSAITKLVAKSFFGFKNREIRKLRKTFNTKFGLMMHEKRFIEKGPFMKGNKEFILVRNKSDLLSDKTKLVYSIEGAHNLHGANKPQSGTFKKDIINHLLDVKHWDVPVFMLTLCHFQYNYIAGQAYAIPIPSIASFLVKRVSLLLNIPKGKPRGFTLLGKEVVDLALDANKGNRILIDLKHASVETRKDYYSYLTDNNLIGQVPAIISHVGVSGIDTFDRQINEVDNKKPNEAKNYAKFNPWGINICDEDILAVMRIGGIIGISLDQRILGESNGTFKKSIRMTLRKADVATNKKNLHACLWLENIFHLVKVAQMSKAWDMICLSSDNDGVIDPINCCPTATHLQQFESQLNVLAFKYYFYSDYRGKIFVQNQLDLNAKLRRVLYTNLNDFIYKHFPV
jgi:microsomal dipeptidase-like Zn-dependent dipeptidase